jgi:hypothetical protein
MATKLEIKKIASTLDALAEAIEKRHTELGIPSKVAGDFAYRCDLIADALDKTATEEFSKEASFRSFIKGLSGVALAIAGPFLGGCSNKALVDKNAAAIRDAAHAAHGVMALDAVYNAVSAPSFATPEEVKDDIRKCMRNKLFMVDMLPSDRPRVEFNTAILCAAKRAADRGYELENKGPWLTNTANPEKAAWWTVESDHMPRDGELASPYDYAH